MSAGLREASPCLFFYTVLGIEPRDITHAVEALSQISHSQPQMRTYNTDRFRPSVDHVFLQRLADQLGVIMCIFDPQHSGVAGRRISEFRASLVCSQFLSIKKTKQRPNNQTSQKPTKNHRCKNHVEWCLKKCHCKQ